MNDLAEKSSPDQTDYQFSLSEMVLKECWEQDVGARFFGINFNTHTNAHLYRAAQEGIVFYRYGLDIMKETGIVLQLSEQVQQYVPEQDLRKHCRVYRNRDQPVQYRRFS